MNLHECRVSEASVKYDAAKSSVGHEVARLNGLEVDDAGERAGLNTVHESASSPQSQLYKI
ncbi:hypothetical protein SAMN02745119_02881 [Trichlorobacter thiogenes]|uniref:Uncharacterized protein n=1 Tax=Trichlorobacter thiogenes TaxID=115783 RepID=A0A1T4RHK5_9BACT|nr:hypothetical protein SAMN02745119_02881 [Trichlorobacter thiogenes]